MALTNLSKKFDILETAIESSCGFIGYIFLIAFKTKNHMKKHTCVYIMYF